MSWNVIVVNGVANLPYSVTSVSRSENTAMLQVVIRGSRPYRLPYAWVGLGLERHRVPLAPLILSTLQVVVSLTVDAAVPRHLDVHLIMDNYGTHKTLLIRNWLAKRPRVHVHFTPTYGSWLNLVERWFAELTNKQLRRGVHRSVSQLKTAIREFIAAHHAKATPFVWTKNADEILASIARFAQRTLEFQAAPLIARTTRSGH